MPQPRLNYVRVLAAMSVHARRPSLENPDSPSTLHWCLQPSASEMRKELDSGLTDIPLPGLGLQPSSRRRRLYG